VKYFKTTLVFLLISVIAVSSFVLPASAAENLIVELVVINPQPLQVGDIVQIMLTVPNHKSALGRLEAIAGTIWFDPEAFSFKYFGYVVQDKGLTVALKDNQFGFLYYDEGYMIYKDDPNEVDKFEDFVDKNNGQIIYLKLLVESLKNADIYFYEHLANQLIGTNKNVKITSKMLTMDENGYFTSSVRNSPSGETPSTSTPGVTSEGTVNSGSSTQSNGGSTSSAPAGNTTSSSVTSQSGNTGGGGLVGKGSLLDSLGNSIASLFGGGNKKTVGNASPGSEDKSISDLLTEQMLKDAENTSLEDSDPKNYIKKPGYGEAREVEITDDGTRISVGGKDYTWVGLLTIGVAVVVIAGIVFLVLYVLKRRKKPAILAD